MSVFLMSAESLRESPRPSILPTLSTQPGACSTLEGLSTTRCPQQRPGEGKSCAPLSSPEEETSSPHNSQLKAFQL